MKNRQPILSVGMPVYNGENYLEQALSSILDQTLADMEIIISDNCSTDGTSGICERMAFLDPRLRYYRQLTNIGAGPNYNFVFHKSEGKYFKWAAHDDYLDSDALELCTKALEEDRGAVLAHPLIVDVDEAGNPMGEFDRGKQGLGAPHERFWAMIGGSHNCAEIFGVIRSDALAGTSLIRDYADSDRTLLGELSLSGKILQVSATRFYRRIHDNKSDRTYRDYWKRSEWFNPKNRGRTTLPAWRQLLDWLQAVSTSPLGRSEKLKCLYRLAKMTKWRWKLYVREIHWAVERGLRL